ncbi:MAG: hypothetical protein ISR59_03940 [Anaerolineales bacterium]|uniref:Uncharacterized protein n=1 Tax=Candidatus Desulfolinea nitratireducens TaxID=2841698 RepID=A0A8J6TE13_9CHLR|nr:hypothetical protein [Candidatus Desulfolinea nitratireducens]MBL6960236.1 hypothetical protein [Anaerolineales bacterium]
MFNDRDLSIMGVGAIAAVICLLIPSLGLVAKGIIAFVILMIFMALALIRLGPDRVPMEVFLKRRIKFATQVRQHTYHGRRDRAIPTTHIPKTPSHFRPLSLQLDDSNIYWVVSIWLAVIGIYFVIWLQNGGAEEISFWIRQL